MEAINTFTCLVLLLSLLLTTLFIFNNKTKTSNLIPPSPPSLPIIGHLHHLKKPLHQSLAALSSIHGPILLLRFGSRPVLVVSSAPLAEECFTANDLAIANRPKLPSSRTGTYNHTVIGAAAYGPGWRELRRIATVEVLSGHRLSFFTDIRADEARSLARRLFLDTMAHDQGFKLVDLRSRLFGLAMNVIMMMMAGKRFYGEESGDEEAHRFKGMVEEGFTLSGASNVGDFLPSALGWFARLRVKAKLARIHNYKDRLLQALIDERKRKKWAEEEEEEEGDSPHEQRINKTVIDSLLLLQKDQPEQYTDLFIKLLISSLISAGTDTSSNTIEWAMSLLLNNLEKFEKLKLEIDEIVGNGRLLEELDLVKLPYLHSVIKETLRMYHVAPLLVPHESLEECKVGGYNIPRGTMILVNAYVIQRDPEMWPEPTKFLPERFMEDTKAEGGKFLPFGMGRRRCPGEGLAMREVGLVLGTLVQCFEWRRVDSNEVDMKEGSGLTMPRENPLQTLCRPRQSMIPTLIRL